MVSTLYYDGSSSTQRVVVLQTLRIISLVSRLTNPFSTTTLFFTPTTTILLTNHGAKEIPQARRRLPCRSGLGHRPLGRTHAKESQEQAAGLVE